jgi:hypothetical protein
MEFLWIVVLAVVGGVAGKHITAKFLAILTGLALLFLAGIPQEGMGFLVFMVYAVGAAAFLVPAWIVNLATNENLDTSGLDRIGKFFIR